MNPGTRVLHKTYGPGQIVQKEYVTDLRKDCTKPTGRVGVVFDAHTLLANPAYFWLGELSGPLVREPDNVRNRWRRCRNARQAYGWSPPTFRAWLRGAAPDSYSAGPIDLRQPFLDLLNKGPRA